MVRFTSEAKNLGRKDQAFWSDIAAHFTPIPLMDSSCSQATSNLAPINQVSIARFYKHFGFSDFLPFASIAALHHVLDSNSVCSSVGYGKFFLE